MRIITTITPALTTTFTPASNCFGSTATLAPQGQDSLISNTTDWVKVDWGINTKCYPSNFWLLNALSYTGADNTVTTTASFFSPGICPDGFTNVLQTVLNFATSATCCPGGLSLTGNGLSYSDNDVWCTLGQLNTAVGITLTLVANGTTTTTDAHYFDQRATPIVVQWEPQDLSLFPAATPTGSSATATASAALESAAASESSAASSSSPALSSQGSGLSEGAWAGIGVGAAVGCILLAGVIGFWLLRMKRRAKADTKGDKGDVEDSPVTKAELPGDGVEKHELHGEDTKPRLEELGQDELYEVHSPHKPPEMDSANVRAELEGDWHGYEAATDTPDSNTKWKS